MPAVSPDNRPTLAPAVETLLGTLRRRIRQYIWLEGSAAAVWWLGVAFWITLAADWFFEPPPAVRAVMLGLVVAVLVFVVVRWIGRRILVPITDSNAATLLERRFPELNDALLTAVVLSDHLAASRSEGVPSASLEAGEAPALRLTHAGEAAGLWETSDLTQEMLAETCRAAADRICQVDLKRVFNPRPLWLHCSAATLLSISVAFFAILFYTEFGIWARRTLAMSNDPWPRTTHLEVVGFDNGVKKVARGADLEVLVRADTHMPQVPEAVEIRYRTEGGGRNRATMDRRGAARGPEDDFQEYTYTFRSILADIHFDVLGGDDRKYDYRIQAVDSPRISQMTLHCDLPSYIGRKQPPLTVIGVMQIPMGSHVTVHAAQANKDLVGVQVNSIVGDRPAAARMLGEQELAADRRGFSYAMGSLMVDATLQFTLTDADGVESRDPVSLVLVPTPDQSPQMAVQLDGIGTAVTPLARVAVAGKITDDYGVARVWFERAIDQQEPRVHAIADLPKAPAAYTLANAALELRELALKPGQKLLVSVKAADRCDLGHGPNVSSSERWLLDVVTPEQLRAILEARELVLRQRFEQMMQEMGDTRDLLARMQFDADSPALSPRPLGEAQGVRASDAHANSPHPNLPPKGAGTSAANPRPKRQGTHAAAEPGDEEQPADSPARRRDLRFLRLQGALTNCRKGAPEVLGVAEAFDDICKQCVNNRIDTAELKNRLKAGIAEPLHRIVDTMFPDLDRRLEELQTFLDDRQRAPALRGGAQKQAEAILLAMQKVRDRMIELEDFNEAVELLRNIVEMQKQLHEQTEHRHKEKIRDLLKE
jgi:hypothetical protein